MVYRQISPDHLNVIINNQTLSYYARQDSNVLIARLIFDVEHGNYFVNLQKMTITRRLEIGDGQQCLVMDDDSFTKLYFGVWLGDEMNVKIINAYSSIKTDFLLIIHLAVFDYSNRCDGHLSLSDDKKRFQFGTKHLRSKRTVIVGELDCN